MKKFLLISVFLLAFVFSMFGNVTFADVIEEGTHAVSVCAKIVNVEDFPNVKIIGDVEALSGEDMTYEVESDKCLTKGYKFNSLNIYALKKSYVDAYDINNIEYSDRSISLPQNIDINPGAYYVDDSEAITSEYDEYIILGFADYKLILYKSKQTLEYSDGGKEITEFAAPFISGLTVDIIEFLDENDVFSDVNSLNPYYTAIKYLKTSNILNGYSDGFFRPDNNINRAEFTKILIASKFDQTRIDNCLSTNGDDFFTDVGESEWFAKYICLAKKQKIIKGFSNNTFEPGSNINFVEAAKILVNSLYAVEDENVDPWYKNYVDDLVHLNAIPRTIKGYNYQITRGEMAEMMYRMLNNVNDKDSVNPSTEWN